MDFKAFQFNAYTGTVNSMSNIYVITIGDFRKMEIKKPYKTKWDNPVTGKLHRKKQSFIAKRSQFWKFSSRSKNCPHRTRYNAWRHGRYCNPYKLLGGEFAEYKVLVDTLRRGLEDAMTLYQLRCKEELNESDIKKVEELCQTYGR